MKSKIATALKLKYEPVALIWSDEKPEKALQLKPHTWGCVMWMYASAAKGKTAAFDRETFGCVGGGVGLGFGNQYLNFPGGLEHFYCFLSQGNEQSPMGKKIAQKIEQFGGKEFAKNFLRGERFMKSPEQVKKFLEQLPIVDIPTKYVIFKPLSEVKENEEPKVISCVVNSHQLSALTVLFYYEAHNLTNVIIPKGAGCHQIGIFAYREADAKNPRAVVGLTDIFARNTIKKQLGEEVMTFTVPFGSFKEMEGNVEGSFLEEETWKELIGV